MKPNEEITLNTNLCPLVVPDTYNTFNYEFFQNGESEEDNQFCDEEINREELQRILRLGAENAWKSDDITYALERLGLKFVSVGKFYSPKEYNFSTDDFDLIFETTDEFSYEKLYSYVEEMSKDESVVKYLKKKYSSYDGFWSLTPDNFKELLSSVRVDENVNRCISALIMAAIRYEIGDYSCYQSEYIEYVGENCACIDYTPYISDDLIDLYNDTEMCQEVWNTLKFQKLAKYEMWKGNESLMHDNCDHDDDAVNMVIWATRKGYSAEDLIRMAS